MNMSTYILKKACVSDNYAY